MFNGRIRNHAHRGAAVGVLTAVGVGAIVAAGSFAAMHRTANNPPAAGPSATADPAAVASSAIAPAAATDLTVVAGQILTNGSAGNIEGTVRVAVRNNG